MRYSVLKGVGDYCLYSKMAITKQDQMQRVFEYYVLKAHMKFTEDAEFRQGPNTNQI